MTNSSVLNRNLAVEAQVAVRAARQQGAVSRHQALTLGMSDSTIQRRVADRRWRKKHAGVYVMRSNPPS